MSRILVEASAAFDQMAGIGRYSRNVLDRLVPAMAEHQFTMFHAPVSRRVRTDWSPSAAARTVRYPLSRKRVDQLHNRLGVPVPFRPFTGEQDLVYSPDFSAPRLSGAPRIVTIHDVAFLTHPELITDGMRAYLARLVEREVRSSSHLIAVSQATASRIVEHYGVASAHLSVASNGVDPRFFRADPPQPDLRASLGLPASYLLMVGTLEPRKNHEAVLRTIGRRANRSLPLVLVGRKGWGTDNLVPVIEGLQRSGRVIWLEGLDDTYLPAVYAGSRGVIYPSWTEGFGLPVLEALAAGKPVLSGNDPVFDEVAGELAMQVDPEDDDAILEGIMKLEAWSTSDADVADRRKHAAKYSWDNASQQVIEIIGRVTRN